MEFEAMVSRQRAFWNTGATRSVEWRLNQLKKLEQALEEREEALCAALKADLGKAAYESWLSEIGMTLGELRFARKHEGYDYRSYNNAFYGRVAPIFFNLF